MLHLALITHDRLHYDIIVLCVHMHVWVMEGHKLRECWVRAASVHRQGAWGSL